MSYHGFTTALMPNAYQEKMNNQYFGELEEIVRKAKCIKNHDQIWFVYEMVEYI